MIPLKVPSCWPPPKFEEGEISFWLKLIPFAPSIVRSWRYAQFEEKVLDPIESEITSQLLQREDNSWKELFDSPKEIAIVELLVEVVSEEKFISFSGLHPDDSIKLVLYWGTGENWILNTFVVRLFARFNTRVSSEEEANWINNSYTVRQVVQHCLSMRSSF